MKRKLIIVISLVVIILSGLFFIFKSRPTNIVNSVENKKIENLLDTSLAVKDCTLFPDTASVIKSKDLAGCDCLSAELKESCKTAVSDNLIYYQAYYQLDPSMCDKISYTEGKEACVKVVKEQVATVKKNNLENVLLTYLSANNYDEAIKILENIIKSEQKTAKNYNLLAQTYANKALVEHKDPVYIPKALALIENAVKVEPNSSEVYKTAGFVYEIQPDLTKAIASYDKALAIDPNYIAALARRGHTKEMLGDTTGAMADFTKAAGLDTKQENIYTFSNLCRLNSYINKTEEAIKNCSIVINSTLASAPIKSQSHQVLASMYSSINKYDEALTQLKIAESYNPDDVNLMLAFGNLFMRQGMAVEAEQYSRKAIALDSKKAIAYENLAASLMLQKKLDESISNAMTALSLVPGDVSILKNYKKNVNFRIYSILVEVYKQKGDTANQDRFEMFRELTK